MIQSAYPCCTTNWLYAAFLLRNGSPKAPQESCSSASAKRCAISIEALCPGSSSEINGSSFSTTSRRLSYCSRTSQRCLIAGWWKLIAACNWPDAFFDDRRTKALVTYWKFAFSGFSTISEQVSWTVKTVGFATPSSIHRCCSSEQSRFLAAEKGRSHGPALLGWSKM